MPRRRGYRRGYRMTIYKGIDTLDLKTGTGQTAGRVILQGPSVFCGGVVNFTITNEDANQHGNGWLTIAFVRYSGDTVKAVAGLESFNNRQVIAFRTFQVNEVFNRDIGKSYYTSNMPFELRTRSHRKVNEQEAICIWIKGALNCKKIRMVGDILYYYRN